MLGRDVHARAKKGVVLHIGTAVGAYFSLHRGNKGSTINCSTDALERTATTPEHMGASAMMNLARRLAAGRRYAAGRARHLWWSPARFRRATGIWSSFYVVVELAVDVATVGEVFWPLEDVLKTAPQKFRSGQCDSNAEGSSGH